MTTNPTADMRIDILRNRVAELEAALIEVCLAARRQLEGHGKGIRPSLRLEGAFAVADFLIARDVK